MLLLFIGKERDIYIEIKLGYPLARNAKTKHVVVISMITRLDNLVCTKSNKFENLEKKYNC